MPLIVISSFIGYDCNIFLTVGTPGNFVAKLTLPFSNGERRNYYICFEYKQTSFLFVAARKKDELKLTRLSKLLV